MIRTLVEVRAAVSWGMAVPFKLFSDSGRRDELENAQEPIELREPTSPETRDVAPVESMDREGRLDQFIEQVDRYAKNVEEDDRFAAQWKSHLEGLRKLVNETRSGLEGSQYLQQENASLAEQVATLQKALAQEQRVRSDLETQYDAQGARLAETRAGLQRAHLDVATLSKQIEVLSGQVAFQRSQLGEQTTRLEIESAANQELRIEQTRLASELNGEKILVQELRGDLTVSTEKLSDLQRLLEADIEYRETMQRDLATSEQRVHTLEAEAVDLASELELALADLVEYKAISSDEIALRDKTIIVLEGKIAALEGDKVSYREELSRLNEKVEAFDKLIEAEREASSNVASRLAANEKELTAAKAATLRGLTKLTQRDHALADLKAQKKADAATLKTLKADLRSEMAERKSLAKRVKQLEAQVAKQNNQLTARTSQSPAKAQTYRKRTSSVKKQA